MRQLDMDLLKSQLDVDLLKSRLAGPVPLLLYFSAEPCTVCHAMLPKLQKALLEMDGAEEDRDYHLTVIESEKASGNLRPASGLYRPPPFLIFWEGREVLRESRFMDLNQITRILSQIIESRSSGPGVPGRIKVLIIKKK
jgi:hypothetical protein